MGQQCQGDSKWMQCAKDKLAGLGCGNCKGKNVQQMSQNEFFAIQERVGVKMTAVAETKQSAFDEVEEELRHVEALQLELNDCRDYLQTQQSEIKRQLGLVPTKDTERVLELEKEIEELRSKLNTVDNKDTVDDDADDTNENNDVEDTNENDDVEEIEYFEDAVDVVEDVVEADTGLEEVEAGVDLVEDVVDVVDEVEEEWEQNDDTPVQNDSGDDNNNEEDDE